MICVPWHGGSVAKIKMRTGSSYMYTIVRHIAINDVVKDVDMNDDVKRRHIHVSLGNSIERFHPIWYLKWHIMCRVLGVGQSRLLLGLTRDERAARSQSRFNEQSTHSAMCRTRYHAGVVYIWVAARP